MRITVNPTVAAEPDREGLLNSIDGVCCASSFEQLKLWQEYHERVDWVQGRSGRALAAAEVNGDVTGGSLVQVPKTLLGGGPHDPVLTTQGITSQPGGARVHTKRE